MTEEFDDQSLDIMRAIIAQRSRENALDQTDKYFVKPVGTLHTTVELAKVPTGKVRVTPMGYDVFFARDDQWRGAATEYVLEEGAEIFRALGREKDGSLQLREERVGSRPYLRTGRIKADGSWTTETVRPSRKIIVRTTARGVLGSSERPITSTRVCTRRDGSPLWTAEATTTYVPDPDRPGQTARRTSGTFRNTASAIGTFETLVSSHGDFRSVSTIPPHDSGFKRYTLPDGTRVIERSNPLPHGGGLMNEKETLKVTKNDRFGGETRTESKTETIISSTGKVITTHTGTTETSRHFDMDTNKTNPKGGAFENVKHTEIRDANGKTTTVDETTVFGPNGERSHAKHTQYSDGSSDLDVLTFPLTGDQSRRVQHFDKDGNQTKDESYPVQMDQSGNYVRSQGSSGSGSSETTNDDSGDDSGDDDSGGGTKDGESPHVAEDDDDGLGDDGGESESCGDPDGYGDETGPPGLSWDGQSDGLLSFLRDRGHSLFGGDDPYRQCDTVDLTHLTPMLTEALRGIVDKPSHGGAGEDLGDDTPGLQPGVAIELGTKAGSVADPWGDWGDFSNPKAHRDILMMVRETELANNIPDVVRDARIAALDLARYRLNVTTWS